MLNLANLDLRKVERHTGQAVYTAWYVHAHAYQRSLEPWSLNDIFFGYTGRPRVTEAEPFSSMKRS